MVVLLLTINALLTLPFGIAALAIPAEVFAQFGLQLDAGGALVARGYGATLVGYGLALWLLRHAQQTQVVKPLLLSMVCFNAIEAIIQGVAGVQGLALPMIFGNVALHGLVGVACMYAYFKQS